MPTVHLLIKGTVQGVFYRATAKQRAEALDLRGWIRNTPSGDVEAVATGSEKALQAFVEWCKSGPDAAVVTSVSVTATDEENFSDFRIKR